MRSETLTDIRLGQVRIQYWNALQNALLYPRYQCAGRLYTCGVRVRTVACTVLLEHVL